MDRRPPPEGPDEGGPWGWTPPPRPAEQPPPIPAPLPGEGTPGPLPTLPAGPVPRLREMRLGELLDAAVNLYRSNWKPFMGIVAFVVVPLQLLQNYLSRDVLNSTAVTAEQVSVGDVLTPVTFALVQFLFVTPFLTAAIARATSEIYLGGAPAVGEVYRFALRRVHSILWVLFLGFMVTMVGLIALIIPGIIFYVRFSFSNAVVIVEGPRGTKAMGRSWRLAKGFFWKILGTLVLAAILTQIVAAVTTLPTVLLATNMDSGGWLVAAIGNSLGQIITTPFSGMVIVLLYFDMRIRKEGFDLALMAQEMARQASA